jgi:glycosyltransferase involved in cell wall biosynthesis
MASTSFAPAVSAVLCTRNGGERLRLVLESLCRQTLAAEVFEVVVVDDGSTDGTPEVVREFEPRLRLRYSRQRSAGIASARNHGIFCARGLIVAFIDDDLADPALLERHLETHRRFPDPRYAVVGRARLDASLAADPLMRFAIATGWPPFAAPSSRSDELLDFPDVAAGRSSWKRSFLLDYGVFNPAFRAGGEGIELAHRLARHGLEVVLDLRATSAIARGLAVDDVRALLEQDGRARLLVARLHEAPAVQRWAGIADAEKAWDEIAGAYGTIVRSAHELDRLVRTRLQERLPVDDLEHALLHRSYLAAFRASRLKGIAEAAGRAGA